ncbi:uncharacterized protein LOC124442809 isoform X3 [Xenia sp. Carnegie-2017]|uniref:uncharacterized protein LOC124442809 isoform X3 n=1 Tax=Xenia sp. Carnegie-2017 TaxID=2897299 RepID=UPI001F04DEB1|nr:uncharacterized protein LOC124442809 isoform X3 [Xenia sp. Carnegie-2017]
MMSKNQDHIAESDSDWDSLPGDITQPGSSPEPSVKTTQATVNSAMPTPPKEPSYTKHPTITKPAKMYRNTSKSIKKSNNATTFEDHTKGLWNDDAADIEQNHFLPREKNNISKDDIRTFDNQDSNKVKNSHDVSGYKKPPFTDFREALSSPIPSIPNPNHHHQLANVNHAYRIETSDDKLHVNQQSWDASDKESPLYESCKITQNNVTLKNSHEQTSGRQNYEDNFPSSDMREINENNSKGFNERQQIDEPELKFSPDMQYQHFNFMNQNFENCGLIQVAECAYDDRYKPSFFHGSKNHFLIKQDEPRPVITDIVDKSDVILQKFWREIFGAFQIFLNFFVILLLELFKTIVITFRRLIAGIFYICGDHFIKPLLTALFNNFIQPISVLLLNIFVSSTNLMKPLLAVTRELLSQLAIPLHAFRLFAISWESKEKDEVNQRNLKIV